MLVLGFVSVKVLRHDWRIFRTFHSASLPKLACTSAHRAVPHGQLTHAGDWSADRKFDLALMNPQKRATGRLVVKS
jgi:hypothetical protein